MKDGWGRLHLIQLAGGKGLRAGGFSSIPKQFRTTGRGMLFAVSLQEFLQLEPADVVVTAPTDWHTTVEGILADLGLPHALAEPGLSRTASTWHAVLMLESRFHPDPGDLVAVHDAARPFASADLLKRLCRSARTAGGAVPGVPVHDTIVKNRDSVARYLDRELLKAVQTPQVFRWDIFRDAHAWASAAGEAFTDDGGLLASRGHDPVIVVGEPGNWKVTTAEDWRQAEVLLSGSAGEQPFTS